MCSQIVLMWALVKGHLLKSKSKTAKGCNKSVALIYLTTELINLITQTHLPFYSFRKMAISLSS
jgi:hypothetical protein